MQTGSPRKPLYTHLYFQVLVAIAVGVALGALYPELATRMKPLGDAFIRLVKMGEKGKPLVAWLDQVSQVLFGVIGIVMRFAPIGAFGAMAFTVGAFGVGALGPLVKLMACVYLTCLVFIVIVLGTVARLAG